MGNLERISVIISIFDYRREKWVIKQIKAVDFLIQKYKEYQDFDKNTMAYKSLKKLQIDLNFELTKIIKKR